LTRHPRYCRRTEEAFLANTLSAGPRPVRDSARLSVVSSRADDGAPLRLSLPWGRAIAYKRFRLELSVLNVELALQPSRRKSSHAKSVQVVGLVLVVVRLTNSQAGQSTLRGRRPRRWRRKAVPRTGPNGRPARACRRASRAGAAGRRREMSQYRRTR